MNSREKSSASQVLHLIALIFVFWALMTMAVSIPYMTLGPEQKAPEVHTGGMDTGASGSVSSAHYVRILWIIFISILTITFILYSALALLHRDKEHFKGLFMTLIGTIIMVGLLLGMAYLSETGTAEKVAAGFSMGGHISSSNSSASNGNATSDAVVNSATEAFYGFMVLLMALVAGIVYVVVDTLRGRKIEKIPSQTEELMEKIELAMRDLEEGKKVHDVILRAYEEMCRVLEKSGVKGEESLTPREFQDEVIEQTGIDPKPVERLTTLFEEARYSEHPIDDSKRMEAIKALGELKTEMKRHELEERIGSKA